MAISETAPVLPKPRFRGVSHQVAEFAFPVLGLILAVLPKDAPLVLAADDTIERRNGRRIAAKGCYRDPVRSSVKPPIRCFGLKWVCLAVLVPVPWGGRPWALPEIGRAPL